MTRPICVLLALSIPSLVMAEEFPAEGPARLAAARKVLGGTVSKFEFTQGYNFRKKPELLRPLMEAIKARGFDTWDQSSGGGMWKENELAALEETLKVAGDVGLRVWATLTPPSGNNTIADLPVVQRREYYTTVIEQFARLAVKYPHFVAFTCDDFSYNFRFFTPEVMADIARRWRAICPRLLFLPLLYYPALSERFFKDYGPYVDGIVFHYRAESYPAAIIPAYDPKKFEMYGDVMRYELEKIRRMAGDHVLICGIYIWYYENGWGVLTPDGKRPSVEHTVRDAVQKISIARDYADGVRVYGLGVDHDAYRAMGELAAGWRTAAAAWGANRADPQPRLRKWQTAAQAEQLLGCLLQFNRGMGRDLSAAAPWPRWELLLDMEEDRFAAAEAARRYPILVVSKSPMLPRWCKLLEEYVRAGGILVLEFMPGWSLDSRATTPTRPEQRVGNRGVLTLEMASLSGITFRQEPRGFATRWRIVKDHPLTKGMGQRNAWQATVQGKGDTNYPYLAYPVTPAGGDVLIEVEHERCPYDGQSYVRKGQTAGTHPLLTVKQLGRGLVVRHYAAVDPRPIFGKSYETLLANLLELAASRASTSQGKKADRTGHNPQ